MIAASLAGFIAAPAVCGEGPRGGKRPPFKRGLSSSFAASPHKGLLLEAAAIPAAKGASNGNDRQPRAVDLKSQEEDPR